jgi:ATP-binding cassette subfamily B protein
MRVIKFILESIKPFTGYLCGMVLIVCIVSIADNFIPYLIKLMIDAATNTTSYKIHHLLILYMISQLSIALSWSFSDWCNYKYQAPFRCLLTNKLLEKIYKYQYSFFQNNLSGQITAKFNDVFNLAPAIINVIIYQFFHMIIVIIAACILLSNIHYLFVLGLLVWIIIFLSITFIVMKRVKRLSADSSEAKSLVGGKIADYLTNIINVKCFAAKKYEITKLSITQNDYIEKTQKAGRFLMRFYVAEGLLFSIYIISCVIFLLWLYKSNYISAGDFAFVFMINFKIVDQLFNMSHQLREFTLNFGTLDQALKIFDIQPEIQDIDNATELKITKGEIIFDQVGFKYPKCDNLFENKSVVIKAGQRVGLVGYSGSGKTTFVNLILRLFDVTGGKILIDDQDIRDVTQDSLHKAIGLIPQDPSLFHRSLRENICYGKSSASEEEIIEAAKRAHAHAFITKLPNTYDSLVGERGVKLSGGQRQRIAIARAILKNAPVLILDEATSALDSITEQLIQSSLLKLMKGKTTIVIAHRLSTLLHMDRILVFDNGKIVEDGTHAELFKKQGLYKTLWDAQSNGFLPAKKEVISE